MRLSFPTPFFGAVNMSCMCDTQTDSIRGIDRTEDRTKYTTYSINTVLIHTVLLHTTVVFISSSGEREGRGGTVRYCTVPCTYEW